ncbi:MAG: class I SAM-dependent methyltransferase [Thermoleophilia bacterium]|nr:class I SAM-dependent methyltransferase [Thermoleophilia bacterium]
MAMITDPRDAVRRVWSSGDYPAIARRIAAVGRDVVAATRVGARDRVLDVACGAGNATLPAARTGADVVGLDLTPGLLDAARAEAGRQGLRVRWVEGDAQELPFPDASFDVVLSTFGCMFAPDQVRAAGELTRVLRPGGRLGVCGWTPDGSVGELFALMARHAPGVPPPGPPPTDWGDAGRVERLLGGLGDLRFLPRFVDLWFASATEALTTYEREFGPVLALRDALEPEGGWEAFRDGFADLLARAGAGHGNGYRWRAEYLLVTGRAHPEPA